MNSTPTNEEEKFVIQKVPIIISTSKGNEEIGTEEVKIPKENLKYDLNPSLRSESKILFYNANDITFYGRKLENPKHRVWILRKNDFHNYGTKRMMETAYEMNIELGWRVSTYFDLVADSVEGTMILYNGVKVDQKDLPSVVIPRFGSLLTNQAINLLKHFERCGIPIINNWQSLNYARDKFSCYQVWASKKLPVPKSMLVKFPIDVKLIETQFEYPFILKKSTSSQGKGIMKINDQEALKDVSDLLDESNTLVIQEFVAASSGRDIRVLIIGGKVIGAMMRIALTGYKSNFHKGGCVKKVSLSPELEWLALETAKMIGLEICGVDFLIDEKNGYKICEINASPGFEGFELASGMNIAKLFLEHAVKRIEDLDLKSEIKPVVVNVIKEHVGEQFQK
jgi:gamma-F420-2:alpha-L-glutamate ligase